MNAKQDRQGVRTPADLERKYNLGQSVTTGYVQSAISAATSEYKDYVQNLLQEVEEHSVKMVNGVSPDENGAVTIDTKDLTDSEIADLMSHMQ